MAATGYTPISLYYSTTASAVPTAGNLADGELALNIADMKLYAKNSSGTVTLLASNAGAGGTVSSVDVSGGTTGLTTSGGPITSSGTITLAGTLNVANGGTGLTSLTAGYIPFGAGTSAFGNSSNLFWDSANARLGIGTSSPAYKLEVNGGASDAMSLFNSTNANGAHLRFAASGTVKSYIGGAPGFLGSGTADDLGIRAVGSILLATNGSSVDMTLDSSGNLGLGVTPSAWQGSVAQQIGNYLSLYSNNTSGTAEISFNSYKSAASTFTYKSSDYASKYVQTNGAHAFYTAPVGTAGNAVTFTQVLAVNASGAIGVGSSPSYGTSGQVLTSGGSGAAPTWTTPASGGGSFTAKTTNYTAASGDNILADTSSASWTLTLPSSPTTGNSVQVMDSKGSFGQYPLTVGRNGSTIMGASEDMTLAVNGAATTFVYNGSTWRVI